MKRGKFNIIFIFLAIFLMQLISAEISIDELHSLYSIGDKVIANVTLSSSIDTVGFFRAYLVCGINEIETYKSIESLKAGEEKRISVVSIIENSVVGSLAGECFIRSLYGSGEARSQPFTISRLANVGINLDNAIYSPGDAINITGKVIKDNREPLNGFVEIFIEGADIKMPQNLADDSANNIESTTEETQPTDSSEENATEEIPQTEETTPTPVQPKIFIIGSFNGEVINGEFYTSFVIPDNAPPGTYNVRARAYDLDNFGIIMNSGESSNVIRVKQVIGGLDIALNSNSITPGNEFLFTPLIYDQAGNYGEGEIVVNVHKPDKSIFSEKLVKANEPNSLFIEYNFTPGFWEVKAKINELEQIKPFFIEELIKISSNLENGTLTIKNIGNVQYNGPVEIIIGNESKIKIIDLPIGESISFGLAAPDGEYEIIIKDGKEEFNLGKTFLTGNAIGVNEVKNILLGDIGTWVWMLIIIVLLVAVLIIIRKIVRKKYFGKIPKTVITTSSPLIRNLSPPPVRIATTPTISAVIDRGVKQETSVIVLKIRNLKELQKLVNYDSNPLADLDTILLKVKARKSKIYVEGDYRIIIFLPSITKTHENDLIAMAAAQGIESDLQNHNKSSLNKIEFGIGIHSGFMAVESHDGKTKFVSLDNTVAIAKRVADNSKGVVLLSDILHKKNLGKVRIEKLEGTNYWKLNSIMNHTHYEDFIHRFLNRQKVNK